ncbi:MAG: glycosyltransferase [Pikeienuella sp.]|uniref:glycosyltransferase n=1 Tax=Pikeienuella sp. TaxID=2831957 RepID=UPI0039198B8D
MSGVVIDVARTLSRAGAGPATGIDRVERAWIEAALAGRFGPAAFSRRGRALDAEAMRALLPAIDGAGPAPAPDLRARLSRAPALPARLYAAFRRGAARFPEGSTWLNLGHSDLTPGHVAAARAAGAARAVVMIHDLIPLERPDLARPGGAERMRARLAAAAAADAILVNSADTAARLRSRLAAPPPITVAPLGVTARRREGAGHGGFVVLGTIEPRKNHAMLLDIWARLGPGAPALHIVGRRGWMNEAVFARLDARQAGVIEHGALDDEAAGRLLSGARALLFPSLAEGYGLPLAEALATGVPAFASDLPALRETGGAAAVYLPAEDAAAWEAAIRAAIAAPPPRPAFAAPTWEAHFRAAEAAL